MRSSPSLTSGSLGAWYWSVRSVPLTASMKGHTMMATMPAPMTSSVNSVDGSSSARIATTATRTTPIAIHEGG
jgi:hypothetical protein